MRPAWLLFGVLAVACSKKSEPPRAGSGSPVAVATPADAPVVDAAVVDAAQDAAVPEVRVATTTKDKLVIARLDASGVKIEHQLPASEMATFAWLDATTLAVKEPFGKDDKPVVMKLVDGKPTATVELAEEWMHANMLVTAGGEVWLERCTEEPEGADPCTKLAYERVWPSKQATTKRPQGIDADRVSNTLFARGFQRAPTVAAPPDVKLAIKKNTPKHGQGYEAVSVFCTAKDGSSLHPDIHSDDAQFGYVAKATRWVLADPPIYEVEAEATNPVGQVETTIEYFRPCRAQPLDGFIHFGGGVWGEYKHADVVAGTWTFRAGTRDLGTLDGTALRANR
jgi:hypothetical protein